MNRREILRSAKHQRENEVLEYQINIDNFRMAIDVARHDPDLTDFVEQLEGLLRSNILEQKKSKVMLHVIRQQLDEMESVG